jgi:Pterin 4 alpha carbinolamine dehydratase
VADAAEAASHHPDVDIRRNKVTRTLTTHSADRFISNNTTLAHRIQRVGWRPSPPAGHGRAVTSTGAGRLQPQAPPAPATAHQPDPHHRL